jgi:hypothetical protein
MGRREIFHNSSLLLEIEGHFTHEFVTYVYEIQDWAGADPLNIRRGFFSNRVAQDWNNVQSDIKNQGCGSGSVLGIRIQGQEN